MSFDRDTEYTTHSLSHNSVHKSHFAAVDMPTGLHIISHILTHRSVLTLGGAQPCGQTWPGRTNRALPQRGQRIHDARSADMLAIYE